MKKFVIQIIALVIVIILGFLVVSNPGLLEKVLNITSSPFGGGGGGNQTKISQVQIGQTLVNIELADTPEKRAQGLGGRDYLPVDTGMLFVYPKADRYKFWMKGMKIPLDFVWIKDDRVVQLMNNILAPTAGQPDNELPIYQPDVEADKVLELNAGFNQRHNIQVGDPVQYLE